MLMRSTVFFRAVSGVDYELTIEHDSQQYVPKFLSEDDAGWIQDLSTDNGWDGLISMSHDLKCEIKEYRSDVGD
jgi:hypothetical protein